MRRLRDERHRLSDDTRFFEAVLDDAPTALLTIDAEGKVELANKAARRLLVRHTGVRIEDFAEYGDAFAKSLTDASVEIGRAHSELKSLMRISYAVFCLKKNNRKALLELRTQK